MPTPPILLSTLAANAVPYEWHDAVAIVAQIVEQLRADLSLGEKRVPELNAIALEQNGAITFESDARQSVPAMPGAALLLQQLLGGRDQPAHLRLLAMQASIADPPPTLEAFAADLAGWERPNRQAKLAALYAAARAAQDSPQSRHAPIAVVPPPAIDSRPESAPAFAGLGVEAGGSGAESPERHVAMQTSVGQPPSARGEKAGPPKATPKHGSRQHSSFATLTTRELAVLGACGALVIGSAAWIATGQPIPFVSRGSAPSTTTSTANANAVATPEEPAPAVQGSEVAGSDAVTTPPIDSQPPASVEAPTAAVPSPAASSIAAGSPAEVRAPEAPAPKPPAATGSTAARASTSPPPAAARPAPRSVSAPARSQASATARPVEPGTSAPEPGTSAPIGAQSASAQSGAPPAPPTVVSRQSAAATPRVVEPTRAAGSQQVRTGSPQPPVAADDPWFGRATPAEPSGREYRAGDPGVVEPVALARLPRKPDPSTPRDRLQVLEVHVNTDGTVESARFIVRPPTYRNRWWVSAAKSWRFRPALKDGKPVRFVMTIPFDEAGGL